MASPSPPPVFSARPPRRSARLSSSHPPPPPFHPRQPAASSSQSAPVVRPDVGTSYEHLSAIRSTHEAQTEPPDHQKIMLEPPCSEDEGCGFAHEGPLGCEECAQECEDASCDIQFTSQCTDQCVVVACNDAHHGQFPPPPDQPCGKDCPGDVDHAAFVDQFLECCNDFQYRNADRRPYAPGVASIDAFMLDNPAIDPYLAAGAHTHLGDAMTFPPLDSANSTPQLIPSPVFESSPSPFVPQPSQADPLSSLADLHSPSHSHQQSPLVQCKWGGCYATFSSLSDLVDHVNLEHLRLPTAQSTTVNPMPTFDASSFMSQNAQQPFMQQQQPPLDTSLACLWSDCHIYPNGQPMPGPSTGDPFTMMDVLMSHLLRDHLGLSVPPPSMNGDTQHFLTHGHFPPSDPFSDPTCSLLSSASTASASSSSGTLVSTPTASTLPLSGGPPTPTPEHDCASAAAHACRWVGCGRSFASCDALTEHIAGEHIGGGRAHYDCFWEGCARNGEAGFASKQKISRHMQSHTGHRPFQCRVCHQNFSEAATLAQHMRRHTQEKPYVCDFPGCGKAFAIAGALTIHKRTHNGSKPFKCSYCDRAFSESSNLSKHLRTHTGARPYPCTEAGCNKSFARPDQLARHANIHKRKAAERGVSVEVAAG